MLVFWNIASPRRAILEKNADRAPFSRIAQYTDRWPVPQCDEKHRNAMHDTTHEKHAAAALQRTVLRGAMELAWLGPRAASILSRISPFYSPHISPAPLVQHRATRLHSAGAASLAIANDHESLPYFDPRYFDPRYFDPRYFDPRSSLASSFWLPSTDGLRTP